MNRHSPVNSLELRLRELQADLLLHQQIKESIFKKYGAEIKGIQNR
ncbi:hypothetical protein ACIQZG_13180 [Lysinibacillus sp. NPDC096418]